MRHRGIFKTKQLKFKKIYYAYIFLVLLCGYAVYFMLNLRPVITTICSSKARIICNTAINGAVVSELDRLSIKYDDLVTLRTDENGAINALETDSAEINRVLAQLTEAVNRELSKIPEQDVGIPLGTLSGIQFFSGRGPRIKLRMAPYSSTESSLENKFDSAGINQTRHQIMMHFETGMAAILVPYTTRVDVVTDVCIAETVIIGAVPSAYADLSKLLG